MARVSGVFQSYPITEAYEVVARELHEVERTLLRATTPSYRRGGLIAVRAVVTSLPFRTHEQELVETISARVFSGAADVDVSVRLAAFEAFHALVRNFQQQLLNCCFLHTFRALACGITDGDKRVLLLAREVSSAIRELVIANDTSLFKMELFVTFVNETFAPYCCATGDGGLANSVVIEWILEWISYLLNLPGDDFILQLWRLLKPLLILSGTYNGSEVLSQLQRCLEKTKDAFGRHKDVQIAKLVSIASECVHDAEVLLVKKNALEWVSELYNVGAAGLVDLIGDVVRITISQLGSRDLETRLVAQKANQRITQFALNPQGNTRPIPFDLVLKAVLKQLADCSAEETRIAALEWIVLVQHMDPQVVENDFDMSFDVTVGLLCDRSLHVVHKAIEVIYLISGEEHFDQFVTHLINLTHAKADVLLSRAPTIIKQLQLRYQGKDLEECEKLCLRLAAVVSSHEDKRFVEKFVITLSTLLLTSREFLPLREVLHKGVDDARARTTFLGLYDCFCYNTVSTLSLCLLSRAYEHAYQLVRLMGSSELSANTLVQLERLARLIETPAFSYIRIALMEPSKCLPLVRTLFAIQLILPQCSPQYSLLYRRIKAIPCLARLESENQAYDAQKGSDPIWDQLLEQSKQAQDCITDFERKFFLQQMENEDAQ
uniref:Vacuolar protein 14 C-terminal Fig4-binding domain-containing protein n=1 Tax=Trypanosoma congolense (strain IL3000) TaxID=1068625 RepID=G0UQ00_TRYCI|nr:conserved hypothetical protein [Trypanosoma congolense IL3000]